MMKVSRRKVFHALAATGGVTSGLFVSRADAQVTPDLLRFRPEVEPLVTLIEQTPREKCADVVADQLRRGTSYRQIMAALFLAGIRNVNPRPPGFALHSVFVIHSAHLLSLEAPPNARLFTLFYALDHFKAAQERDAANQTGGDYTMRPIGGRLPSPDRAAAEFLAAMEAWDSERAERAVVSLARYQSPAAVTALLWSLGARDYRNIGHKAIYVANAARTLQTIGWQHAEPVYRSVTLSLTDFGKERKLNGYAFDDQCYRGNVRRAAEVLAKLANGWQAQSSDSAQTRSVVEAIRTGTPDEVCASVAGRLTKGATAGTIWDAVHLGAAELRMRANAAMAIGSIHAVTSANALHYSYLAASDPATRLLILLQAAGWVTQFRTFGEARPESLRSRSIFSLEAGEAATPEEILAAIPANTDAAASRVFKLAAEPAARAAFLGAAVGSTVSRADEVHYYKYLAALIEDIPLISAEWQPHLLATSVYYLKGAKDPVSAPVKRAQEILHALPG
ncbi:MAG TPA: hypothetical protein VFB63_04725 [Bryobacteraceae bacterium]|nr:hypothetical protein [Bryobacteraceae bacterium]